jgi:protein SFI1
MEISSIDHLTATAFRVWPNLMFRPRRTSSPSRTATTSSHTSAPGKSFTATTPELASLAPDEIDFIDQVIAQAGPNASTFLSVLNAYNDVLRARGLDSRDEVVYYGKLLKLGTLKGRTWAEKWAHVRGAQAAVAGPSKPALQTTNVSSRLDRPLHRRDPDTFTLHSHDDNEDEDDSQTSTPRIARRPLSPASELSNSLGLSTAPLDNGLVRFPTYSRPPPAPPSRRPQLWESISVTSDSEEHTGSPTAAISAYQPGYRQNPPIIPRQRLTSDPKPPSANTSTVVAPTASRQAVEKARQGRSHNINDEDAWAKIKQARDEEDADVFRREQLLTRCWAVWREGLVWVAVSTHLLALP